MHKSSPNESIIEVIEFTVDYRYFKDLGLNKLITELSYDEKYLKLKTSFLIDILKEQLRQIDFKDIKDKYFIINEIKEYRQQREYRISLKKAILSLKLMKNLVTKLSETNYLFIYFTIFILFIDNSLSISKKKSKIERKYLCYI